MQSIIIQSHKREEIVDITEQVQLIIPADINGSLLLFCQHTTCGLTINEGADPDVKKDLLRFFQDIAPKNYGWQHAEGNTDAHIRSSLLGVSLLIPFQNGKLCLGTWQSIYLYEGDGPRRRTILVQFLEERSKFSSL